MAPPSDTVIYLDIDGVLNVGIGDHANAPLLLHEDSCNLAFNVGDTNSLRPEERECFEKVISVVEKSLPGGGETGTYRDYACIGKQLCSDILLRRVAQIIKAAGDGAHVVLASNWRLPKYRSHVLVLEKDMSKYLGRSFSFDSTTEVVSENGASDRLRCIGEHVREMCASRKASRALRVLVLDDFFVTPLKGWACEKKTISCAGDVESYLRQCAQGADATVKMVHCYDRWRTKDGYRVEVGTGLTAERAAAAMDFLGQIGRRRRAAAPASAHAWASKVVSKEKVPSIKKVVAIGLLALRTVYDPSAREKVAPRPCDEAAADSRSGAAHLVKF